MKKIISILLVILMLCSCSANEPAYDPQSEAGTSQSATESKKSSETEEPKIVIYQDENEKFGLKYQYGEVVLEACYDGIKEYNYRDVVSYIAQIKDVPMRRIVYDENGEPYVEEILSPRYYFLDAKGKRVIDIAFEYYGIPNADNITVWGTADGNKYEFLEVDGKLVQVYCGGAFEEEKENGFVYTGCYYNDDGAVYARYGMKKNGKVLFDNVNGGFLIYFGNRLVFSTECKNFTKARIADENGNILCEKFHAIGFNPVDENRCIGIALVGTDLFYTYNSPLDENGEPMPRGMWFIDKDGNIISERFEYIELLFDSGKNVPWMGINMVCSEEKAKVTYASGETAIIDITEYLLDY